MWNSCSVRSHRAAPPAWPVAGPAPNRSPPSCSLAPSFSASVRISRPAPHHGHQIDALLFEMVGRLVELVDQSSKATKPCSPVQFAMIRGFPAEKAGEPILVWFVGPFSKRHVNELRLGVRDQIFDRSDQGKTNIGFGQMMQAVAYQRKPHDHGQHRQKYPPPRLHSNTLSMRSRIAVMTNHLRQRRGKAPQHARQNCWAGRRMAHRRSDSRWPRIRQPLPG